MKPYGSIQDCPFKSFIQSSIVEANSDSPLSHLFFSLSSCGGRAGRTYMSSTSSLLTPERLGRGSVLEERSSDITAEENGFTEYNGLSETLSVFFLLLLQIPVSLQLLD